MEGTYTLLHWGRVREGFVEGCPERFDMNFLHYVLIFRRSKGHTHQ